MVAVQGRLVWEDLESGFFAVDGWRLVADPEMLRSYLGQYVVVYGTPDDSPSIFMVRALIVRRIHPVHTVSPLDPRVKLKPVDARRPLPDLIAYAGAPVAFDVPPEVVDGILMISLRAVVERAGGSVSWDPERREVGVTLAERRAVFAIGQAEALLAEGDAPPVSVSLQAAPRIQSGRTLISADALTAVLDLWDQSGDPGVLDLVLPASLTFRCPIRLPEPLPAAGVEDAAPASEPREPVVTGVIEEVRLGEVLTVRS